MQFRRPIVLLLLAGVALAEDGKRAEPEPFDVPPPGLGGWPGVRVRYYVEIERCKERLQANPADADALERALDLCDQLGRTQLLVATARRAVEAEGVEQATLNRNRGVLGRALLALSNSMAMRGNFIRIVNGRVIQNRGEELTDEQRKLLTEAAVHLAASVKTDRTRPALRFALAEVLEAMQPDPQAENMEANRLREEAESITIREGFGEVATGPYAKEADGLIHAAQTSEQVAKDPDHMRALELRKKALVLSFCRDTIPFDFTPALYEPVSMLAPRNLVFATLTRTFQNAAGNTDEVGPNYHAASFAKQLRLLEDLGKEQTSGADAVLLALIRGSQGIHDPLADAAANVLASAEHGAAARGLPLVLAKALYAQDQQRFPVVGQRRLVDLAAALKVTEAAAVLAVVLARDSDLRWPRGAAHALGRLGQPEHADALKRIALDPRAALCFRREAARAFALLAFERATELDGHSELDIALAAARYERAPDESTLGRLLNGFANELEIGDAAQYCVELRIAEARPAIDAFLAKYGENQDHPARLVVARAQKGLSAEG